MFLTHPTIGDTQLDAYTAAIGKVFALAAK
jgi:hypothetical protein